VCSSLQFLDLQKVGLHPGLLTPKPTLSSPQCSGLDTLDPGRNPLYLVINYLLAFLPLPLDKNLAVLEFELRTKQALYHLSHTSSSGHFFVTWTTILLFAFLCAISVMICTHQHTQLLVEMKSPKLFCLGWPQITILPISASQVARITGLSHWFLAKDIFGGTERI
jgi:hypothetical protein